MAKAIVTGDKEIDRAFAGLEVKIQAKALRASLRAGAQRVQAATIQNITEHPTIDEGRYVRSYKVRARKRSRTSVGYKVVSTDPKANVLEYGTKNMPAEPSLRRAGYDNKEEVRAMLIRDVQDAAKDPAWTFKKTASAGVASAKQSARRVVTKNRRAKRKAGKK